MNHFFVLDTETGGFDEQLNPITEIAIVVLEPRHLQQVEVYQTYVKPYNDLKIGKDAIEATQISMKDIESGKDIQVVLKEIAELTKKYSKSKKEKPIMVGHNTPFDFKFIKYAFELKNKNIHDYFDEVVYDTWKEMKRYESWNPENDKNKYKLGICCERIGIKLKSAHGALADTYATTDLFRFLTNLMRKGDVGNIAESNTQTKREKARNFFEF